MVFSLFLRFGADGAKRVEDVTYGCVFRYPDTRVKQASGPVYTNRDIFEAAYFFKTSRPFGHTKPVNLFTETAFFKNCSPQLFKALSTRITVEICGFKNVRIRFNGVSV